MSEHETVGDPEDVECPWCGRPQCLSDPVNELGPRYVGETETCRGCGKDYVVDAVDYDVTVTLRRAGP